MKEGGVLPSISFNRGNDSAMARHAAPSLEIASDLNAETPPATPATALRAGVADDRTHGRRVDNNATFLIEDIIGICRGLCPFLNAHVLIKRTGFKIRSFRMLLAEAVGSVAACEL